MRDKRGRASKFGEKTDVVSFRVPLSKKKFFHKKIKELILNIKNYEDVKSGH